jgi:hypothetical protein
MVQENGITSRHEVDSVGRQYVGIIRREAQHDGFLTERVR